MEGRNVGGMEGNRRERGNSHPSSDTHAHWHGLRLRLAGSGRRLFFLILYAVCLRPAFTCHILFLIFFISIAQTRSSCGLCVPAVLWLFCSPLMFY